MNMISEKDRKILRGLAQKQAEYAHSPQNAAVLRKWCAQAAGKREAPTVRLLFSNFTDEVVGSRLSCEGEAARQLEWNLLSTMVGVDLFGDDTPIESAFHVRWDTWVDPFGIKFDVTYSGRGQHINPVITDLSTELDRLRGGGFGVDRAATQRKAELASDVFGDILPVKMVMGSLYGNMTHPLVMLMGMENYYFAMYDTPDELHAAMDLAASVYERYYTFLEEEQLLLPTNGLSAVGQESFALNCELPADHVSRTTECWGFLESQETTAVSPELYGEFVYPYQQRLVDRFGLLSYGCCERVDALWEKYLSKWEKLRKLSVSPFNNEAQIGEYLRGSRVVYYSKPRAEYLTNPGPIDEGALRDYFKGVCEAASGCLFEMAQREVGTIFGDFARGRRYVEIAKECIERWWRP